MKERTFCTIKPDAVAADQIDEILSRLEAAEFRVVARRQRHLSRAQAEVFYEVHKERPYFDALCEFMSSGPCLTLALERDNAILGLRVLMGATDPANARPGTIRKDFGTSLVANVIHGSDGADAARAEIAYFFAGMDLLP